MINQFKLLGVAMIASAICAPAMGSPVSAVLRLNGQVSMKQLADNVTNPLSARYGRPYSPEEIRALSAPSDKDYEATIDQLKAEGLTIVSESPTHLWVSVKGDSAQFENTFATRLQEMQGGFRQQMVRAAIPSRLNTIAAVIGLDNTRKSYPKYVLAPTEAQSRGLFSPSGLTPTEVQQSYGFDKILASGVNGQGMDIAIATYNNLRTADVQYFWTYQKVIPMPTIDIVTFNGTAPADANSAIETQLDAEFSGMMAPGAAIHVFASAENSDAGEAAVFTAILDDNRAKVANYSWGGCETQLAADHKTEMETIFQRAVAQGVNIMVASGDTGSNSCNDGTTAADWPAADDYVVAVGGTKLTPGSSMSEVAWSDSGGGVSSLFALPSWQSNIGAAYAKRSYPDVSFNADPASGQSVYAHQFGIGMWLKIGGTSMAAPQWTGYMTLVNAARKRAGKAPLGYLNPYLYAVSASQRADMFNDVTSGKNGAYSAGPGWDAVTGWGSMKAQPLLNYLSAQ